MPVMRARRQRRRRFGRKPRLGPIPAEHGIAHRPQDVTSRTTFGHWEGDLVMLAKELGKANVTSLLERTSRFTVLVPNADRRSAAVIGGIRDALAGLPQAARGTITFDRGTELATYPTLARDLGVASYFCDPHSPWPKGAVENSNGRLRRHLPRDVDPASLTGSSLGELADRLNDTPRRCLGYRTPREVFNAQMTPLPAQGCIASGLSHFA